MKITNLFSNCKAHYLSDRLKNHVIKQGIIRALKGITLKQFNLLSDSSKNELFTLYRYTTKGI